MSDIRLQCVNGSGTPVFLVNNSGVVTASSAQITNSNVTTQTVGTSRVTTSIIATGNSNTIGALITTGGNIGIGITTPSASARLDVRTTAEAGGGLIAQFGGSSTPRIQLYDSTSALGGKLYFNTTAMGFLYGGTTILNPLGSANAADICIGINTSSPEYTLDVNGTIALRSGSGSGGFTWSQIAMGFENTNGYAHAIKTRHQAGANNYDNAMDFYVWQSTDNANTAGSRHVLSATSQGVGIGTGYPLGTIHVSSTSGHATVGIDSNGGQALLQFYNSGSRKSAIYKNGNADWLGIWIDSAGTNAMTFGTTGNIGIINDAPKATLSIGGSNTFGQLWLGNAVQNRKLVLYSNANNEHEYFGFGINTATLRYQVGQLGNDHVFYAGTSSTTSDELMRIQSSGGTLLGIGTSAPAYKVHVSGGDIALPYGNAIRISNVANVNQRKLMEVVYQRSTDQTVIYAPGDQTGGGKAKLAIQHNNYIGINTTAPDYGLDVRGTGTFSITSGSTGIPLTLTNYNVNWGSSVGLSIGQGNQWTRLYDYFVNQFGNNFTMDMTCQNSTYTTVLWADNWWNERRIGINKQWPDYPVDIAGSIYVNGGIWKTLGSYGYMSIGGSGYWAPGGASIVSIYASNRVTCSEINAFSDERIKTDIQDINDDAALQTIRAIQPKRYNYIDQVARGEAPVWGFVAQQVASVLDYSTTTIKSYIPNIYKRVTVTYNAGGSILSSNALDTGLIDLNQTDNGKIYIRIFIREGDREQMLEAIVKEILSETQLQIENVLDEDITEAFLYGQKINDFRALNKDAIFTVSVAALQEVDRQLQTAEQTIEMQDQMIDTLNGQIQDILTRIASI